jgi:chitinase
MKNSTFLLKRALFWIVIFIQCNLFAQTPSPALVGYWHNWNTTEAPYIQLNNIDTSYNVVIISFALPTSYTDMTMTFVPEQVTQAAFISQIQQLQSQGKKVLISIGGATGVINLADNTQKQNFINSMNTMINTFGFDGIDIDIEHGDGILAAGTIASPTAPGTINLILAIESIMNTYQQTHGHKMFLTMAPETAYVQGGMSAYGSIWGGYLPLIHALSDDIDIVSVQLYNSGTIYGIDGNIYTQGTADFIVALTEATIQGFSTTGGLFAGLPASKVAVGLPACSSAAGGGYTDTATVAAAIRYLKGEGPQPGSYTLTQTAGYPDLRGMMTWSINWDAAANCGGAYTFAQNFNNLFNPIVPDGINDYSNQINLSIFPNPTSEYFIFNGFSFNADPLLVQIFDCNGKLVLQKQGSSNEQIDIKSLHNGIYLVRIDHKYNLKLMVQH